MSRSTALPAAVLALLSTVSGCTGDSTDAPAAPGAAASSSATTPESAPDPPPVRRPEPPPGAACYRMGVTLATRPTNASRPVPCREPHTAQTIHVGRLDLTPGERRVRVDSPAVQRQLARVCPVQLRRYVGGTTDVRRRSRFEVVWFSPTLDEAAQGARWFRCDAVAVAEEGRLLRLPLGPRLRGVLDRPGALTTYGLCGTDRPGAPGFRRVACALPHSWAAISTINLTDASRYPGASRVRTAGNDACADEVRERSGPVLEFSYGWEWPTAEQWAAGQHYGYCWAPSRPS